MRHLWKLPVTEAVRRTPAPVIAALILSAVLLAAANDLVSDPLQTRLIYAAAGLFFGAVIGETVRGTLLAILLGMLAAAALGFADRLFVAPVLLFGALAVGVLVAPVLGPKMDAVEAWRRLSRTTSAAGLALFGAGLVVAGVYSLELSAEALLGLDSNDLTRNLASPLAVGLLAPIVFLTLSARQAEGEDDRIAEVLGLVAQTFARLVLTPLLAIYAVVLAIYVVRIIVMWELPSNEIGWIVPLFGVTGALTYLATAAIATKGRLSRIFLSVWFPLTLVPVALFILALWIRIDAHGVTADRYYAILVAAWLGMNALAFTATGGRADVRLLPVTLLLVLALGAVGPWSLRPVVVHSQTARVLALLPEGDLGDRLRDMSAEARRPLCSAVEAVTSAGGLPALEARLGEEEPGIGTLCRSPFAPRREDVMINFSTGRNVVTVDGPSTIWGPVNLFARTDAADSEAGLALTVEDGVVRVTTPLGAEEFDLVPALEAWAAENEAAVERPTLRPLRRSARPASGAPIVLEANGIALWIMSVDLLVETDRARVRGGTVYVVLAEEVNAPAAPEAPLEAPNEMRRN
ncbi:DUF4153 domain-containing protein [Acuticoccus sp. M5D2P5]|uniref:DUF4153 domain-containing protein n=1 Tax=Acuticoccus kalidii TaxID=2910977 RepID=UPI001F277A2D|nr:DUF4153 domain-containing protein [Acuticoccus kalidii]MCF3936632.1 DUF4153 domain-containing protein [Acuticoccus kalidii]